MACSPFVGRYLVCATYHTIHMNLFEKVERAIKKLQSKSSSLPAIHEIQTSLRLSIIQSIKEDISSTAQQQQQQQ